ncbi:MAG: hypothetical protein AAFV07_21755, partial [Bacteroidota bacterium]
GIEVIDGVYNDFALRAHVNSHTGTGAIVPLYIRKTQIDDPIPEANFDYSFQNSGVPDMSTYELRVVFEVFDYQGRLLQQKLESGVSKSYLYDEELSLPVAEIIAAPQNLTAYTSFEDQGNLQFGGWEHVGIGGGWNSVKAKTGNVSFDLNSSRSIRAYINGTGTFRVAFWI